MTRALSGRSQGVVVVVVLCARSVGISLIAIVGHSNIQRSKQVFHVAAGEGGDSCRSAEDTVGEVLLLALQSEHALFHAGGGDEIVDEDGSLLADAVGAIGRLHLGRCVPPRIVVDHRVGGDQIETSAAGLQADQKYVRFPGFKLVTERLAITARAGETQALDVALFETLLQKGEHLRKLGKNKDAAPLPELGRE